MLNLLTSLGFTYFKSWLIYLLHLILLTSIKKEQNIFNIAQHMARIDQFDPSLTYCSFYMHTKRMSLDDVVLLAQWESKLFCTQSSTSHTYIYQKKIEDEWKSTGQNESFKKFQSHIKLYKIMSFINCINFCTAFLCMHSGIKVIFFPM